jgi:hypothetical protein
MPREEKQAPLEQKRSASDGNVAGLPPSVGERLEPLLRAFSVGDRHFEGLAARDGAEEGGCLVRPRREHLRLRPCTFQKKQNALITGAPRLQENAPS